MTGHEASSGDAPMARYERFASFSEYEERLDALIPRALGVIRVFEPRLSAHYNSQRRCALLQTFLLVDPGRRLYIVVHDADALARLCPRLTDLALRHHEQLKMRRTLAAASHVHDPHVIVDSSHYLHRFHHAGMRAAQGTGDITGAQSLIDRYEALWEASTPVRVGPPAGL